MYYTYAHYTPKGDLFYIGKGKDDRAYSYHKRSYQWREIVAKNRGINVQILADWNTEKEALSHEELLISCFKDMGAKLVNLTDGGLGLKGYTQSPETRQKRIGLLIGYKHKNITCPICKKEGGETSMKRWHFDKCTGNRPFKARISYNGKRVYLGYFATQQEADQKCIDFYASVNKPLPKEFIRHKGIQI
jgi:hypothetical protein